MRLLQRLRRKWIVTSRLRTPTIRARLMLVVVALVIPAWLGMAAVIYSFYQSEREHIVQGAIVTSRALMVALDRDLAGTTAAAQILAASPLLASDDFAEFHREAKKLLPFVLGSNFVISDSSGRQLVNTRRPYGDPLPPRSNASNADKVFETGKPSISNVFIGNVVTSTLIAIDVPVFRGGAVKYSLAVGVPTPRLNELLIRQRLPEGWIAAIIDASGTIAGRTHSPELFVGRKGAPLVTAALQKSREGVVETATAEGIPVHAAFSRSENSNWGTVIGIPVSLLSAALNRLLLIGSAGALAVLLMGLTLAFYQSNQIARAVQDLIPPALALGRGEVPKIPRLHVREASDVAKAIARASQLLQDRTSERDSAKDKKDAAEAAAGIMDEFVATVSHELRTPLTSIAASLGLLAGGTGGDLQPPASRLIDIAHANTQRLVRLINDILDIGKIDSGKMTFTLAPTDLRAIAEQAIEVNRAFAQDRDISIRLDPEAARCVVRADADRLSQVAANLLSNAVKFSPSGETVTISIGRHQNMGRMMVRDHGAGIPDEFKPRIFKKFSQANNSETRQAGGTGLGLNIVQKIVTQHGGSVGFEAAPGGGTIFRVDIPLWDVAAGLESDPLAKSA